MRIEENINTYNNTKRPKIYISNIILFYALNYIYTHTTRLKYSKFSDKISKLLLEAAMDRKTVSLS